MMNRADIKKVLEEAIKTEKQGKNRKLVVFPYGHAGRIVENVLIEDMNITPAYVLDNQLCKAIDSIHPLSFLEGLSDQEYVVVLSCINPKIYKELRNLCLEYFKEEAIIDLCNIDRYYERVFTEVGKYSYGPIAHNHYLIKKIGNFCCFAEGVDVVPNHPMQYISIHPMMFAGQVWDEYTTDYEQYRDKRWYFEGVQPHPNAESRKRITIGNDVWLGRNVIITNYSNIGNGVVAAAGAIITKDVPDYAIVAGVPAKIIRYRYTKEQIDALNRIQWWNWDDDVIRERYDDLYLPIEDFVRKYDK